MPCARLRMTTPARSSSQTVRCLLALLGMAQCSLPQTVTAKSCLQVTGYMLVTAEIRSLCHSLPQPAADYGSKGLADAGRPNFAYWCGLCAGANLSQMADDRADKQQLTACSTYILRAEHSCTDSNWGPLLA